MNKLNESEIVSLTFEGRIAITKLKERLKQEFHVIKFILFGSKA